MRILLNIARRLSAITPVCQTLLHRYSKEKVIKWIHPHCLNIHQVVVAIH